MVPRLQKRGSSFKGVCAYILHDAGKTTANRVDWTATQNLISHPENAWFEMFETYRDSDTLKERAGRSSRGRKNTAPVLHYMLSWHKDDKPTPEHMREAALSSLKALGLEDHQALLAAHHDKEHLHVHIVVSTVNPDTGITASLKFTKLDLSKWAEAYEREHGIRCEERITNNAERARLKAERQRETAARRRDPSDVLMGRKADPEKLLAAGAAVEAPARKPYAPVKHKAPSRRQWFEKKAVTDRMRALRADLDAHLKAEKQSTWDRHIKQRDALDADTQTKLTAARENVRESYRPKWKRLYSMQKREAKMVGRLSGSLLDRAAYVFQNRERLGIAGKPLTLREMVPLIKSPARLLKRVGSVHEHERRQLARESKVAGKEATEQVWQAHRAYFGLLRDRQAVERKTERDAHAQRLKSVSFALAKASLVREVEAVQMTASARPFKQPDGPAPLPHRFHNAAAPPDLASEATPQQQDTAANANAPPALSRSEQMKRDMAEWRRRNTGRDLGREL